MAPSRSDPRFVNDSPTVYDLYDLGKEMMNSTCRNLGTLSVGGPEDRNFRSFFWGGRDNYSFGVEHDASPGINSIRRIGDPLPLGFDVHETIQL